MSYVRCFTGFIRLCSLLFFVFSLAGCFFEETGDYKQFESLVSDIGQTLDNKQIKILQLCAVEIFRAIETDFACKKKDIFHSEKQKVEGEYTWYDFCFDDFKLYLTQCLNGMDKERKNLVASRISKLKVIKKNKFSAVMRQLSDMFSDDEVGDISIKCQKGCFGIKGINLFYRYTSYQDHYLRLKAIENLYLERKELLEILSLGQEARQSD